MLNIEFKEQLDEALAEFIDAGFNRYADKNNLVCDYHSFCFIARDHNNVVGILTGHSYYKEVHISDLIVLEEYRKQHIGSSLIQAVEKYYKNAGFENINLSTYAFQAPEFYKKCGFQVEFVRDNVKNPKLAKYFFIKFLI